MGYNSQAKGFIFIDPPLTAKELREHKNLLLTQSNYPDAYPLVETERTPTDDGEIVKQFSNKIAPIHPDSSQKRYELEECLSAIVSAFPDRNYSGRIELTGEDGDLWAYAIKGGKVKELRPTIVWPEE